MFCGELDGELQPSHIAFRADTVRHSICDLWSYVDMPPQVRWRYAYRAGWRVVKVAVVRSQRPEVRWG